MRHARPESVTSTPLNSPCCALLHSKSYAIHLLLRRVRWPFLRAALNRRALSANDLSRVSWLHSLDTLPCNFQYHVETIIIVRHILVQEAACGFCGVLHQFHRSLTLQNGGDDQAKGAEDCPPERAFAAVDEEADDAEDDGACDDEFHDFISFLAAAARSRHRPTLWATLM